MRGFYRVDAAGWDMRGEMPAGPRPLACAERLHHGHLGRRLVLCRTQPSPSRARAPAQDTIACPRLLLAPIALVMTPHSRQPAATMSVRSCLSPTMPASRRQGEIGGGAQASQQADCSHDERACDHGDRQARLQAEGGARLEEACLLHSRQPAVRVLSNLPPDQRRCGGPSHHY